jgi:hypothetical protein
MTYEELVSDVKARLSLTSPEATIRIASELNARYKQVTTAIGLTVTRRATVMGTASLGDRDLTFTGLEKVLTVSDRSSGHDRILDERLFSDLRQKAPGTGIAKAYAISRMAANSVTIFLDVEPQAAFELWADGYETAAELAGTQLPQFPESFHDVLVEGVLSDELRRQEKPSLAAMAEARFTQRLSDLKFFVAKSGWLKIQQHAHQSRITGGSATGASGSGGGGSSYTQNGLVTFDRDPAAPFAVSAGSASVTNLDADRLDGEEGSAFHDLTNATGTLDPTHGGTGLAAVAQGDLLYASATDTLAALPKATSSKRYLANTGTGNSPAWDQVDLTDGVTGDLPLANLAQGAALSVLGVTGNATADVASIAAATDGHVLRRSGTSIGFGALDLAVGASGALPVARLTNGVTTVLTSTAATNQNDWAPGLSGNTLIVWSGASDISITGFAGGVAGQLVTVRNAGTHVASFPHASTSSTSGNRFTNHATSGATPIAAGGAATWIYDGSAWQLVAHEQGAWITPTFAGADYTAATGTWTVDSGDVSNFRYMLRGRSLAIVFNLGTMSVSSSTATLKRVIPGGFTSAADNQSMFMVASDNGSTREFAAIAITNTTMFFLRGINTAWSIATNTTALFGSGAFEVQ